MSNKIKWHTEAGNGISRTVSSYDMPPGSFLYSYRYGSWGLCVDAPDGTCTFSIDELEEIIQKLKQLNERDTHNGRDTYRERAEEQIPQH